MKRRVIGGLIFLILGIVFVFLGVFTNREGSFSFIIYSIPLFLVGLIIFFNKNEDVIEKINYSKKGGSKK